MIHYIINIILCSGFFLLGYFLLFQKEKMHVFKRFYLLSALALSLIIPLIPVEGIPFLLFEEEAGLHQSWVIFPQEEVSDSMGLVSQTYPYEQEGISWTLLVVIIYCMITSILLIRFCQNLFGLLNLIQRYHLVPRDKAYYVLVDEPIVPFSFLEFIFINNDEYAKGSIPKEVLTHELAHVRQHHSLDILWIELLLVVMWFNPVLYFYKKAIQLNHEFLADDAVIKTFRNEQRYQKLLLTISAGSMNQRLASPLNYLITKMRLTMITKSKKRFSAFRQVAVLPLVFIALFIFCSTPDDILDKDYIVGGEIYDEVSVPAKKKGYVSLNEFIGMNIKYPQSARAGNITGVANIQFVVSEMGRVESIQVVDSLEQGVKPVEIVIVGYYMPPQEGITVTGYFSSTLPNKESIDDGEIKVVGIFEKPTFQLLEDEVIRVFQRVGDFEPATINGKPVKQRLTYRIKFQLA